MIERLEESNFVLYAAKCYENVCYDTEEFYDDLKRFQYLRRLFGKYVEYGDLKERLILNHIVIIYNVFGDEATRMLMYRLQGFWHLLKPFLVLLNRLPNKITGIDTWDVIYTSEIQMDEGIIQALRNL